jgi:NAD(P)-dependent dehydrogenase (short-subunit alcohol dehydrogenase family)
MKKTAFITGGNKGIGFGIAQALVEKGYNVVLSARSESSAQAAASKLNEIAHGSAIGIKADVRDRDAMRKMAALAVSKFGGIDVVVANAGLGHFAPIDVMTDAQWDETIDINVTGVYNTVKATLDALKKSQGYLITIASLAGTNFFAGGAAYNASKFAVVGFTQAVMLDVRAHGIKTTTIMPGSVTSHFNNHTPNETDDWKIQPEDIGQLVNDLLEMPHRALPSKIEIRPTMPGK